jgi:hypothetical protein
MSYPAVIFWVIIAWSVAARPRALLVLLLASINFSSLAIVPTQLTFGMSLLPQLMFAVVLICKVLVPEVIPLSPNLLTALRLRNLGFLALFLLVGVVVTLVMPRLFSAGVVIVPMRESLSGGTDVLHPTQQNFTQTAYLTLSVMTVFAVMLMADQAGFAKTLLASMLAGGAVCLVAGLIDIAAASTGMQSLLTPFRTAEYSFLTEAGSATAGRRVVGFAPEASGYGPVCVQFAAAVALLRPFYDKGVQRTTAALIAVGLLVMAMLSTSSTAYLGVAVLGLAYAANWVRRAAFSHSPDQSGLVWELIVGFSLIIAVLFVLVAREGAFDPLLNLIDEVLFNKVHTSSFEERSYWNTTAWNAVASTWGLGIGFGSTRTSNWFAAIVSNSGLIGAALMGLFLVQTFIRHSVWRNPLSTELLAPLKLSLLPALAMVAVVSPGPDFGPWTAVVFGAITGIAAFRQRDDVVADGPMPARFRARRPIGNRAPEQIVAQTPRQRSAPISNK